MRQGRLFPDDSPGRQWFACGRVSDFADGKGLAVDVEDHPLALFRTESGVQAIDGRCPHANAPLARGWLEGTTLVCPLHRWKFDVTSGHCLTAPAKSVRRYDVRIDEQGVIWVALDDLAEHVDRSE
jgi:NAD(P)H-dependent nitrite reductase small subunit